LDNELLRRHDGHITHLTLNRPHKANALSASLVEALINAVEYAYTDDTRLLVIDGGGGNFCAGFDFADYQDASDGDLVLRFIRIEHLLQQVYHAPYATLALVHGRNFGAGADIFCACAARIADPGASFRLPGLRFGLALGTRRLARRIGTDAARALLATSDTFDAVQALRIHFATEVAPRASWPETIAAATCAAQSLTPSALARMNEQTTADTRAADMLALVESASVPGLKERIRIFREKTTQERT